MSDLLAGLGLLLVLEGLLWALAPRWALRMLEQTAASPEMVLRLSGTIAVAAGVGLVWLVRG